MKKNQQKSQAITATLLTVFSLGLVLSIVGLSQTMTNIETETISRTPEAVLTSAGVSDGADISLPVVYFDQKSDECVNFYDVNMQTALSKRQFEWTSCGYNNGQIEQGLVGYQLGDNYLPVAVGGKMLPNRGLNNMDRWFTNVEGKSKEYNGTIKMIYRSGKTVEFSYTNGDFYPLDDISFSNGDNVNKDGHNHLFTMNFAIPFTVMADGNETFEITADDDTFVYVGMDLALDMGGIHEATNGKIAINEKGEVYTAIMGEELAYSGIQITKNEGSIIRIFHADRDANESVFKIRLTGMNLNVVQTQLASGSNGVQVAYDPTDPSYVKPLGETSVFRPDGTKGYLIVATVLGVAIVTMAMFTVILAHALIKSKQRK
ncbi:hypothetical protein IKF21_02095 [Candidatus Saccharibacteria bacterium]|nr:hypothetical protein [Candidatus Saccharibacteria bacterium]